MSEGHHLERRLQSESYEGRQEGEITHHITFECLLNISLIKGKHTNQETFEINIHTLNNELKVYERNLRS
jgi:hypothetical protein